MESEKRKPGDDGEMDGKRVKGGDDHIINGRESKGTEEEEEEVEEFFAILKRIQVAVKYFEKGNCSGSLKVRGSDQWRPSFLLQDFEGENDDLKNDRGKLEQEEKVENLERNSGLDLNSEPVSKDEH